MIRCSSGHETATYWNIRDTRANNKGGAVEHAGKNGGIHVISDWDDGATTSTSQAPGVLRAHNARSGERIERWRGLKSDGINGNEGLLTGLDTTKWVEECLQG